MRFHRPDQRFAASFAIGAILLSLDVGLARAAEALDHPVCKTSKDGSPDQRFIKRHEGFIADAKKGGYGLVLVGDFLTDDWRGNNKNGVGAIFEKAFGRYRPLNLGQGGDHVQHVLWRMQNGELDGLSPKAVMLLIGGTNGSNNDPPDQIAAGIAAILSTIKGKCPDAKVLLLSVPPWVEKGKLRTRHTSVNALLPKLADGKTVVYIDLTPRLIGEDGLVSKEIMPDGVHLSDKGYQIWADAVEGPLKELMGGD